MDKQIIDLAKRIQNLYREDSELYGKLLRAAMFSTMRGLQLNDALALSARGLVVEEPNTFFHIERKVVECVRYWGLLTPQVPEYSRLEKPVRGKLKLACFRSLQAVGELEKVARSSKPVEMDPVAFKILEDPLLLRGVWDDPLLPEEVRNFFGQFPEQAGMIPWFDPVKPGKRLDAWY
jgi:hypothetical protein